MEARDALRPALRVLLAALGVAFASLLAVGLAYLLRTSVDFALDTYRAATYIGVNAPKALAVAALAIVVLLALPLAIADAVSSTLFRRAERELRDARPHAQVGPYEGPEGRGLAFDAPEGRTLLLAPPGGLGAPRTRTLPPVAPPAPPAEPAPATGEATPAA